MLRLKSSGKWQGIVGREIPGTSKDIQDRARFLRKRRELVAQRHSIESSTPRLWEASNLASPKYSEITISLICYMNITGTNCFHPRRLAISCSFMERIPDFKLYALHRNPPLVIFYNFLQYLTTGIQTNTYCQKNIIQFEEPHNKF